MTTTITIEASVPDDDLEAFLHWVRTFDKSHTGCHFAITGVSESDKSTREIAEMLERLGLSILYEGRRQ